MLGDCCAFDAGAAGSRTTPIPGLVLGLFLVLLAPAGHATTWLREVLLQETGDVGHEIELVLGAPVELMTPFTATSATEFVARARSTDDASPEQEYAELYFDERQQQGLERVTIEGSARLGFEIKLVFREPVRLETIPQYSSTRLSLVFTDMKTFRRLNRFAGKPASDKAPVAVTFRSQSALALGAVTPEIAASRQVYRNPNDPDEVRVGFYPTETAAMVALRALRGEHPDVALTHVSAGEVEYAKVYNLYPERLLARYGATTAAVESAPVEPSLPVVAVQPITPSTIDEPPEPPQEVQQTWNDELDRSVLDQAQDAYTEADYDRAIALYTKAASDPRLREEAMEMLGVARERNGQLAHAKAQYERFLAQYPDSPAAGRVSQRLTSLIGSDAPVRSLRTPAAVAGGPSWYTSANISQFYQRYSLDISGHDSSVPIDGLFTDVNLFARRQSDSATHEARLDGGYMWDFSDDEDSASRVHRLTWSSFWERPGLGFTIGRQSRNDAGILGRYDGATITWRMRNGLTWNVIGGYVARTTYDNPTNDRPVFGVNAEIEMLGGDLEVTPFYVEQWRDGVVDRRAVGMHTVWFTPRATFSSLVDYDTYHQVLNNLTLTSSFNLNRDWRLAGTYDFRRSPYLTTSNALIGQRYDDLSELEKSLVDMKLDDLAEDRTAKAHLGRLGLFGNLNDTWSVSVDGSVSHYSETDDSLGITGLDSRTDYYVTAQVRANDLLGENTFTSVQARYMGSETSKTTQLYFANRFAFDNWYVFPKLVMGRRTFDLTNENQDQLAPSLRIDYRGFRRFRLEAEAGYEWTMREQAQDDLDIQGLFFRFGYRTLF